MASFIALLLVSCSSSNSLSSDTVLRTDTVLVRLPAMEITDKALNAAISEAVDSISTCPMLRAYPKPYLFLSITDLRRDTLDFELQVRVDKWFHISADIPLFGMRGGSYHDGVPLFIASPDSLWDLNRDSSQLSRYFPSSQGELLLPVYQQMRGSIEVSPPINARIVMGYRGTSHGFLRTSYSPCGSGPSIYMVK